MAWDSSTLSKIKTGQLDTINHNIMGQIDSMIYWEQRHDSSSLDPIKNEMEKTLNQIYNPLY